MIDTTEVGGGSYPSPEELKKIDGVLIIAYKFEEEVPKSWDREKISEWIKENFKEIEKDTDSLEDYDFREEK